MALRQLDQDLFVIDHDFRMFGVRLGTRTSIVRLRDGTLAVHGPGPFEPADLAAIDALGPVSALIGPNLMHNLYLPAARARWPEATLLAPAGLQRKLPQLELDIALGAEPLAQVASAWRGVLEPLFVPGMPALDEYAWLHPPSGTLILTDLAFNVRAPQPWWTRLFMNANGGWDRFGPTRVLKSAIKQRGQAQSGIAALIARDFDRAIVAHGDVLESGARAALRSSYAWLLDSAVPASVEVA